MRFSKLPSHRHGRYHAISIALGIATYSEEASNQVLWLMSPGNSKEIKDKMARHTLVRGILRNSRVLQAELSPPGRQGEARDSLWQKQQEN